jgi:hypothetical protein
VLDVEPRGVGAPELVQGHGPGPACQSQGWRCGSRPSGRRSTVTWTRVPRSTGSLSRMVLIGQYRNSSGRVQAATLTGCRTARKRRTSSGRV